MKLCTIIFIFLSACLVQDTTGIQSNSLQDEENVSRLNQAACVTLKENGIFCKPATLLFTDFMDFLQFCHTNEKEPAVYYPNFQDEIAEFYARNPAFEYDLWIGAWDMTKEGKVQWYLSEDMDQDALEPISNPANNNVNTNCMVICKNNGQICPVNCKQPLAIPLCLNNSHP